MSQGDLSRHGQKGLDIETKILFADINRVAHNLMTDIPFSFGSPERCYIGICYFLCLYFRNRLGYGHQHTLKTSVVIFTRK